jgi:hypothetical protein
MVAILLHGPVFSVRCHGACIQEVCMHEKHAFTALQAGKPQPQYLLQSC